MLTESANHLAVFYYLDRFHRRSTSQKRVPVTLAMSAKFGLVGWSTKVHLVAVCARRGLSENMKSVRSFHFFFGLVPFPP